MATKLNGSITLNLIPKQVVFERQSGTKIYKNIYIDVTPLKETDEHGNTHSVSIWDKENKKRIYIGRLKPQEIVEKKADTAQAVASAEGGYKEEDGDLPF